jgi:hypothetical protein
MRTEKICTEHSESSSSPARTLVQKKTLESQDPTAKTSGVTGYERRPSADVAPDFEAETTEGRSASMTGSEIPGPCCSRIVCCMAASRFLEMVVPIGRFTYFRRFRTAP